MERRRGEHCGAGRPPGGGGPGARARRKSWLSGSGGERQASSPREQQAHWRSLRRGRSDPRSRQRTPRTDWECERAESGRGRELSLAQEGEARGQARGQDWGRSAWNRGKSARGGVARADLGGGASVFLVPQGQADPDAPERGVGGASTRWGEPRGPGAQAVGSCSFFWSSRGESQEMRGRNGQEETKMHNTGEKVAWHVRGAEHEVAGRGPLGWGRLGGGSHGIWRGGAPGDGDGDRR